MNDERCIVDVTPNEREMLHNLLDRMLDEGQELGQLVITYVWAKTNPIHRTYRIRITQNDEEQ